MGALKLLNHYLCQALHFYLKNGASCPFFKMYQDKLCGAIATIELIECDSSLKIQAAHIYDFINNIKHKTATEIETKLAETREKSS